MDSYDLIVIGSGPAGQKAAIAAAKLGKRAAVVERRDMVGGVCINTGTIPSKTLREAVLYLTGLNQRELYGQSYRVKDDITVADLSARTQHVIGREIDVIRNQLSRNQVQLLVGTARFVDPHTLVVINEYGNHSRDRRGQDRHRGRYQAGPAEPRVDFDGETIVDSDQILGMDKVPSSMVVVGAGVIGIEYASMFAALGTKVTVVEKRPTMLDFCDKEIVEALKYQLRDLAVTFRFSESVREVAEAPGRHADHAGVRQEDPGRHRAVLGRPAGRHRRAQRRRGRAAGQQPRPGRGQRELPDRGRAHLRRRRRHRLPGAGRHRDGAGPAGQLPRVRRAGRQQARRPAADRHLHDPRDRPTSAAPRTS